MLSRRNQEIYLESRPGVNSPPTYDNFSLRQCAEPELTEDDILIRTLYLSVDPALLESFMEIEHLTLPLTCTGMIGLTSLIGVELYGKPKPGDTFVVSGGAGACGSLAGQIAQLKGCCTVVGICGSDEKCQVLTQELGFTASINYKTEDVKQRLLQICPKGIDIYFDNVGGDISDTAILQMRPKGRIVLCGQISTYNKDIPYPPPVSNDADAHIDIHEIERERFLVISHQDLFAEKSRQLAQWYGQGKLKVKETMYEGLDNVGKAFVDMMCGKNIGKMLVKVSEPT